MKTITDETVLAFLLDLKDRTTLLDPSGKVIGHFEPVDPKDAETYAMVVRFYNAEELARRRANPGGRTPPPKSSPAFTPCKTTHPRSRNSGEMKRERNHDDIERR